MGFVLDVADFGARPAPARSDVQRRLPLLVSAMLAASGTGLATVEHEWTGDGINAVLPADIDPTVVLPALLRSLAALLSEDNSRSNNRMRLRMSVGIGLIEHTGAGFGGPMIIEMSRLVNSAPLRATLAAYPDAHLAVAISDQVHSAIIRPGYPGIPSSQFAPVEVAEKEFRAPAWIWISTRQWTTQAFQPLRAGDPRQISGRESHRYRVAARLGSGRASTVYLATSPQGAPLAIKVFHREAGPDTEARSRLAAAIDAVGAVRGPRTVRIWDANAYAGQPWVATPLIPGPSLAEAVAQTGPLPPRSALWLAAGVARGLLDIHMAGITHGALRPSNVLLAPDGPVLTDIGTGWAAISGRPVVATDPDGDAPLAGGAAYASDQPGADDDILALGCVAFFAATGRTPYGECTPADDQFPGIPEDLTVLDEPDWTGCPGQLLPAIQACLLPPARRPSAEAALAQLEEAAGPVPRNWLPPPVAARFSAHLLLPEPPRHPRPSAMVARLRAAGPVARLRRPRADP
ncbi:MAG TPA: serine/threonine-protein kinase [Trebonia sp.]|nr:serine/threonine-protein kinase [Trebonia sp.]